MYHEQPMARALQPRTYSAIRTAAGLVLLTGWTFTRRGVDSDLGVYAGLSLLCYGALQLFEGVARYEPGPTLPASTAIWRELWALGLSVMVAFIALTSEAEGDGELPPAGEAVAVLTTAAFFHFMAAKQSIEIRRELLIARFGLSFMIGASLAAAAADVFHLRIVETLGLSVIGLVAAGLTMPYSWRAWEKWRLDDPAAAAAAEDLRERVAAAEGGEGDEILLCLHETGEVTHVFLKHGDDSELDVPVDAVPATERGHFILVRGARIVTSTRGGEGYRGMEEYERLDEADHVTAVGRLPLPAPRARPLPPPLVEAALLIAIVLITAIAFMAGEWAFEQPRV